MSFVLSLPALLLAALAFARYVRISRPPRGGPSVSFLDLPLGLAVSLRLDQPAVAVREKTRSAFLRSGLFRVEAAEGGRMSFRRSDGPSPWLGELWGSGCPAVYVGSFVAEPAEPSGSQLLLRFSTVPVVGWALVGLAAAAVLALAAHLAGDRGLWFWVATAALLLAVRASYQAEARKVAWRLLELLDFGRKTGQPPG
ncbi:MAG: hypothetical protein ACYDCL_09860 [Myxococcales bacterium]